MSRKTSIDELYTALGNVILKATGRKWWRKGGIQAQPVGPYVTIYIAEGVGLEQEVVSNELLEEPLPSGECFRQTPWGTLRCEAKIEFLRSKEGDTAIQASTRFRNALRLEERYFDLWTIMGMIGGVQFMDVSSVFRADIEPRCEVRFSFYANVADPPPLADVDIFDIQSETINVTHVRSDELETAVPVQVSGNVLTIDEALVYGPDGKPVLTANS